MTTETFNSTTTWAVPSGRKYVFVVCLGSAGTGGAGAFLTSGGGGGGTGAIAADLVDVSAGGTWDITITQATAGQNLGGPDGGAGGDTTFSLSGTNHVVAAGGQGGKSGNNGGAGGAGGTTAASTGSLKVAGVTGAAQSAGTGGAGGTAPSYPPVTGGGGGAATVDGTAPSGGGGGGNNVSSTSGRGAKGRVVLIHSDYMDAVLSRSPILYTRLGEPSGTITSDFSGGAHDGTYSNSPTLGVTGPLSGDTDTAATFASGSSQDSRGAYYSGLQLVTLTMFAWYKGTGTNQAIGGRQGTTQVPYSMFVDSTGHLQAVIKTSGTSGTNYSSTGTINDGSWHSVAITRDNATSTLTFYIDGAFDSSTSSVAPNATATNGWAVASRGGSPFLSGSVDEFAIFSTALSSSDISAIHNAGVGASGVTGTLASTLADATLSASGTETFTGTLASTLGNTTLAATGTEGFTGTLASTLGSTSLAGSGTVANPVTGTLATTLAGSTLAASGTETIAGTLASTLGDATLAASGTVGPPGVTGTLGATLGATTLAATGAETFTGTLSAILGNAALTALAVESMTGTLAATLDSTTLAASGSVTTTPARDITIVSVIERVRTVTTTERDRAPVTFAELARGGTITEREDVGTITERTRPVTVAERT